MSSRDDGDPGDPASNEDAGAMSAADDAAVAIVAAAGQDFTGAVRSARPRQMSLPAAGIASASTARAVATTGAAIARSAQVFINALILRPFISHSYRRR